MRKPLLCLIALAASVAFAQTNTAPDDNNPVSQVSALRKSGNVNNAESLAISYLAQYPNDPDMQLQLALSLYEKKDYTGAKSILNKAIKNYPNYKDMQDLLAQVEKAQSAPPETVVMKKPSTNITLEDVKTLKQEGNNEEAKKQALEYLSTYPNDPDMELMLASIYYQEKNYEGAKSLLKTGLKNYPQYADLSELLNHVESAEKELPMSISGAMSAQISPGVPSGNNSEIKNHLIFYQQSLYSTSPDGYWNFSSLFYTRDTSFGNLLGAVNQASRNQHSSAQGQIGSAVKLSKDVYVELNTTYADNLYIYPKYTLQGEAFFNVLNWFEFSIGDNYENISFTHFNAYTASIQKEVGLYSFGLRTYYFIPKAGKNTNYYIANAERFIGDENHFVQLTLGYGTTPDLADLQTVNFITVDDKLIGLNYERPLIPNKLSINIGASYENQRFPTFIRQLTGISFVLKTGF
ncbi:MAG: YaiO family outer membrane beta-barrel protein [Gammaproteobacteria bacterium]